MLNTINQLSQLNTTVNQLKQLNITTASLSEKEIGDHLISRFF